MMRRVLVYSLSLMVFGQAGCDLADSSEPDDGADWDEVHCTFDPQVPWDFLGTVLQIKRADGNACMVIKRRNDCAADEICKAVPFTVLEVQIGAEGRVQTLTAPAAMSWHSTHHNWEDHGEFDMDGVHYRLDTIFGDPFRYELSASDLASGDRIWGPISLDPVNPL